MILIEFHIGIPLPFSRFPVFPFRHVILNNGENCDILLYLYISIYIIYKL